MTLPRTVDELTADWLTGALRQRVPGIEVTEVTVRHVEWGTATKVMLRASYAGVAPDEAPPAGLCVKGFFDRDAESIAEVSDLGCRNEGRFFRDLAPRLDVPLPRHWFADADESRGIVVLDDLTDAGVRFGSPTRPWTPDQVALGLENLARLHGSTWGSRCPDVDWLEVGATVVRYAVGALFSEQHWSAHFARPDAPALPAALTDRERMLRGYAALWEQDDTAVHCLSHADAHVGNTYLEPNGRAMFLDWASPCLAPWSDDVAYFVTGALTVADRRAHERDLLAGYLTALAAHGGPTLDKEEAWEEYVRHQLHGVIWACLPSILQSPENVLAMAERYTAAVIDNRSLDSLGV